LIEERSAVATLVTTCLADSPDTRISLTHVATFHDACAALVGGDFDAAVVNLQLSDATLQQVLTQVRHLAPSAPVIVLHARSDEDMALEAVAIGAQDCLAVEDLQPASLGRALRYGIERRRFESRLEAMAKFDELTGLANRALFFDRLSHALERAHRRGARVGVLFLDVDRLKAINDGLGHAAGDTLLRRVAKRIENVLRSSDTLALLESRGHTTARLGGDEFAVVLEDVADVESVQVVADRLSRALEKPVVLSGQSFVVTASIGIAVCPEQGTTCEELMMRADGHMYTIGRCSQRI
jgi:diguanylate cyclase (GGDEF)-like protein